MWSTWLGSCEQVQHMYGMALHDCCCVVIFAHIANMEDPIIYYFCTVGKLQLNIVF